MKLRLYNTLTRRIGEFEPINPPKVGMYTCGPTVYDYPTIGNWRTYVLSDILSRVLDYNGFKVTTVMNLTDVGHLTGDNLGNADVGEDRLEKGAKREGKTVWEIAQFYIDDFVAGRDLLNILPPTHLTRATDYIPDQIGLVKTLLDKGLAYETESGLFFDVTKFADYGKLTGQKLEEKKVAVRAEIEEDKTKKNPADFALWFKATGKWAGHQMQWSSPWGKGFPGWHIECSAMSMKYLGETFDIHAGGVDLIPIHHTNEIAQSEGATGKPFVKYWLHGEFLTVEGGRMGKSLGNAYTLHDVSDKGYDPLALRYFYLTAHYRTVLNFSWQALTNAQNALDKLKRQIGNLKREAEKDKVTVEGVGCAQYEEDFLAAINSDLNMPQALAVVWKLVDDQSMPGKARLTSLLRMDKVLGLRLDQIKETGSETKDVPTEVKKLLAQREKLRREGKFAEADKIRDEIRKKGYTVEDRATKPAD